MSDGMMMDSTESKGNNDVPNLVVNSYTEYPSLIVPTLRVNVANYITEIVFTRRALKTKKIVPKVEFWRKEYRGDFKDLTNDYIAELTQVKKLLKIFAPQVLIDELKENDWFSFRYLTKEQSKDLIFQLFVRHIKYLDQLKNIKKTELEVLDDKIQYIDQASIKTNNKLSKGL